MKYRSIPLPDLRPEELLALTGVREQNLKALSELYGVDLLLRGEEIKVFSDDEELVASIAEHIQVLIEKIMKKESLDYDFIKQTYRNIHSNTRTNYQNEIITYNVNGKPIRPKTYHQAEFIDQIRHNDLVFSIGPAGTGKTFIAILMAVTAYKRNEIHKIVLTRPAVEAGESLGFLPGDLKEKVDPYLMPLYDSLYLLLGKEQVEKLIEKGDIEIIPLAYMRGRTLNDAYILLDEAQNTTEGQMLMFLTRLGNRSKMIVNGDITQIDLNIRKEVSGLIAARDRLQGIDGISFLEFDGDDIVRNPLVQKIIEHFTES